MASTWEASGHRIWDARALDLADAAEVTEWEGTLNADVSAGAFADVDADTPNFGSDDFSTAACVNFTGGESERLRSDANLISADGDWTVLFRWQTPTAATTNHYTLASMTAADGTPVVTLALNGYAAPDTLSVDDGSNSVALGNVALDTTMQVCIVHRYAAAELDVYLDGSLVDTIAVTNADGARRIQLGHENAGWNPEFTHDQRFQAVHFIPLALDATAAAALDTYAETLDTDYSGGLTTTTTIRCVNASTLAAIEGARVYVEAGATGDLDEGEELCNDVTDSNGDVEFQTILVVDQEMTGWARKGTATPFYRQGIVALTVSPGDETLLIVPMAPDE